MKMPGLLVALITLLACGDCAGKDTCFDCHRIMEGMSLKFTNDVHYANAISCANCHGGDQTETNQNISMNSSRGFKVRVKRQGIPEFCGKCHADANYMSDYGQTRVDQLAQYETSVHAKALAAGRHAADVWIATASTIRGRSAIPSPPPARSAFPRPAPNATRPRLMPSPPRGMAGSLRPLACPAAPSATPLMPPSRPLLPCSPGRLRFASAAINPELRLRNWPTTWPKSCPSWNQPAPARKTPWSGHGSPCIA